jgi:hypothetical protein
MAGPRVSPTAPTVVQPKLGRLRQAAVLWGDPGLSLSGALCIWPLAKVAPDIEGQDQDGNKFKLSDYREKVVLLDFEHQH